jgi:hypothetical protein
MQKKIPEFVALVAGLSCLSLAGAIAWASVGTVPMSAAAQDSMSQVVAAEVQHAAIVVPAHR